MGTFIISTSEMSSFAPYIIITCVLVCMAAMVALFVYDHFKDSIVRSANLIKPVSWHGNEDGIDSDGVPYYNRMNIPNVEKYYLVNDGSRYDR